MSRRDASSHQQIHERAPTAQFGGRNPMFGTDHAPGGGSMASFCVCGVRAARRLSAGVDSLSRVGSAGECSHRCDVASARG